MTDRLHGMNWDDLRYVLALAEQGSIAAAAQALGVNRTTVLRRIGAFEQRAGLRLFERNGPDYTLTGEAEQLLAAARSVERTLLDLERKMVGHEMPLQGVLRVTTTDALLLAVLGPHLAAFNARHREVTLELVVTNHMLSLTRRDADVAVRPCTTPPETLVARRVGDFGFAVYGGRGYLGANAQPDLAQHRWLGVDETMAASGPGRWLHRHVPERAVCLRADSFVALRDAAEHDLGLALLPCCLGDGSARLRRLAAPIQALTTGLWILTHEDLRRAARVRAFTEHLARALEGQRALLTGGAGDPAEDIPDADALGIAGEMGNAPPA